jgi:anaerobic selenocysteine-containing dehydrogenase
MPDSNLANRGFTRRNFIKGAALLSAAGAFTGCTAQQGNMEETGDTVASGGETSPDVLYGGYCGCNCGGGCYLNVHVRDGQVVRTTARDFPDTEYNRICCKGATHVGRIYSSKRVLYPMRRTGERGSGEFERISWDEAIQAIADKWKGIVEEYGDPQAFGIEWGSGNYQVANGTCNNMSSLWRLLSLTGASEIPLDVDAAVGFGTQHAHGGMNTGNGIADRPNAKSIVMWGCNPSNSLPQTMHFFLEAKEKGARYIVIDPLYNANSAKADWWIPIKPATDGALALGVLNVLFNNGWISEEAIKVQSNCPFLVKEDGTFLRMSDLGVEPKEGDPDPTTGEPTKVDPIALWDNAVNKAVAFSEAVDPAYEGITEVQGIKVRPAYEIFMESVNQYPPEIAAEICGLKPEDVEELARVYHEDGPVSTEMMQGMNPYRNGHYATWPMVLISLLTGNTGAPGAGFGQPEEYLVQYLGINFGATTMVKGAPGQGRHISVPYILDATNGEYQNDGIPLKGLYIHGSNPACTFAQNNKTIEWMNNLDFLVVSDIYMTETMMMADIVLPAAHWFEKEDLGFLFASHPYVCWNEKAVEPQGESKADYEFLGLIAEALGYGDKWPKTSRDFIDEVLASETFQALGINVDAMVKNGAMSIHPNDEAWVSDTSVTYNETGRVFVYREDVMQAYDVGQEVNPELERVPQYVAATFIGEGTENRKEYPFAMLGEKMRTHTHTQWCDCDYVREYEPEPVVRINPSDAEELGISDGDNVRLSNQFGYVVMKSHVSAGVPPKVLSSGRSWNKEEFIDGHYGSLCSVEFNQVCANQAYSDAAVNVEKA